MKINIPVSAGELVDKLTILDIKIENIKDKNKISNIKYEKTHLQHLYEQKWYHKFVDVEALRDVLYQINRGLWAIEDAIRIKEKNKEFDEEFVKLARDVYKTNDKRFETKTKINKLTQSEIVEEKSYESYN